MLHIGSGMLEVMPAGDRIGKFFCATPTPNRTKR